MKITIDGEPSFQKRMKSSSRGGFSRIYDPSRKDKEHIRAEILKNEIEIFEHPLISFVFYMPIPASMTKREKKLALTEKLKHEKKPDIDNMIKLYLDCLDGIVLEGDQKVMLGSCFKIYSENPRTVIILQETTQSICSQELDCLAREEVFGALNS